jgi:hypothetical protein
MEFSQGLFGTVYPNGHCPRSGGAQMTTTPFPMKRYLLLIGVAFSLAVCTEGQVLPTEQSIAYHANPPIVRKVQIALRNRGYYHENVDGYLGGATGIAIQRYQIDHCIRVIPLLDPSLLISLGIAREY